MDVRPLSDSLSAIPSLDADSVPRRLSLDEVAWLEAGGAVGFAVFLAEWKAAKLVKRRRQHTHTSAA